MYTTMDSSTKRIRGKKRSTWSEEDSLTLLELWAERAKDLRRAKRNLHIYKAISEQMNEKFSATEVHVKIRNFTQKYREEKKKIGLSGGSPSTWKYFNAVHRIIVSTSTNSAEKLESSDYRPSAPLTESQPSPSPESQQLSLPESDPLSSSDSQPLSSPLMFLPPLSPLYSPSTSSSGEKINNLGEVLELMKEQNVMLKKVVEDSQSLTNEIVNAIKEQNDTAKEFVNLMKNLIDKL